MTTPARVVRKVREEGLAGAYWAILRYIPPWEDRLADRFFEWWYGVSTAGEISSAALGHGHPDCHHYGPSHYRSVRRILRATGRHGPADVLVDFGSGKGRILVVAATFPYGRIVGVEYVPALTAAARENIARAQPRLRCRHVEFVTTDAASWPIPDDATVLYFSNPFSGRILDEVLARIEESLTRAPRRISLISHSHDPAYPFEQRIRQCSWLRLERELRLQRWTRAWIYTNTTHTGA